MKLRILAAVSLACALSSSAFAADAKGKCEKKEKDGKVTAVEAKSEKECKKKGGTWAKADAAAPAAEGAAPAADGHKH